MPFVPIDWLSDHVEVPADLTAEQLAAALVRVGLEEEEIHKADITGPIVVGKVLTRDAKEQSNGKVINYCRVDVGQHNDAPGTGKEPSELASRGIICGAHNFEAGDYVVVSLPGAVLPGNFEIAARKTYGHISDGMICSARELGIGEDHSGIIVLAHSDAEASEKGVPPIGADVMGYLGLGGDVLEINVTPDRGYCFSMRGVAREFSHSTGAAFTDRGLPENTPHGIPAVNNEGFPVVVEDNAPIHGKVGCDRFVTRIVRGVDINASSPKWMQDRLREAGMRPISLAVDATNYVMLDLGQPLHAYDLDKVVAPIVVRRAHEGEMLTTLDDAEHELHPEDLVIADCDGGHGARAIGLAGTMGGASTEISETTSNVLIEAAHFDAVSVARMARRHRLPSEASKRFEREVDPQLAPVAAQAVVDILVEYGGGTADPANFELDATEPMQPVQFHTRETRRLTGLDVPVDRQLELLQAIGCTVNSSSADASSDSSAAEKSDADVVIELTPPSWRPDLAGGGAYLVEEIARLVGYDAIPSVVPYAPAGHGLSLEARRTRDIARALAEQGWVQVLSYPFVASSTFDKQGIVDDDERRLALRLVNPLQEEAPFMRTSVLDTLLATAHTNVARGNPAVAVFEIGAVTHPAGIVPTHAPAVGKRPSDEHIRGLLDAIPNQPTHVAGVATPAVAQPYAGLAAVEWDWRDAIEATRIVAEAIGLEVQVSAAERAPFHPGRCAEIRAGGVRAGSAGNAGGSAANSAVLLGYAGELAPSVCKAYELPKRSIAFEIDMDAVCAARGDAPIAVAPVETFPPAKEDLALVVDADVPAADVAEVIRKAAGELLEELRLFDVYTGDQVPEGKKSLAYALRLRGDHTLKADETARVRKKVLGAAKHFFGAELRS
ncbi:MAG: phenylalanine--tRNA ligase subunit beta [Actinomycetaceae bacterium]|nr:phenylalanine--tRNA ligase subunit beta [Arcanobacterium sp.]MDD7686768.1 phenylalanine--tRNA ligase subunit beta [Actinomycetaceae bacterium]MDY5273883.1 phenylalanine--tRNA ligase subunit beta [Arcanobacterium sp.]